MQRSSLDGQQFDVIVCGAGSAGSAAAYGAARAGARTLLIERLGFAGGTPVAGMIHTLDAVNSCIDPTQTVVGGFASDLLLELTRMQGLATVANPPEVISFHPEYMKVALDRLFTRAGVHVLYRAFATAPVTTGNTVTGVEAALLDGDAHLSSHCVIDATGDAHIAHHAGAAWSQSAELQAVTYHFRLGNLPPDAEWGELETACQQAMEGAPVRYGGPWVIRLNTHEVSINSTRVVGNPIHPLERTRLEQEAREDTLAIYGILHAKVPALRSSYILSGATDLHVRESRKIHGVYTLTEEDIQQRRSFPDVIALGAWPIDIHPTDGFVGVHPHKENPPAPYEIPYRCLLPETIDGLLIAGRPISTTHRAHGSTRVPGTSMATGQAAGVAAALASQQHIAPRNISINQLQQTLLTQGALLRTASLAVR